MGDLNGDALLARGRDRGAPSQSVPQALVGMCCSTRSRRSTRSTRTIEVRSPVALMRTTRCSDHATATQRSIQSTTIGCRQHTYPVALHEFEDGVFVVAAKDGELVGAELVAVDGVDITVVLRAVTPLVAHDNVWTIRARRPVFVVHTSVLRGLGVVEDDITATFRFRRPNGSTVEVKLDAVAAADYRDGLGSGDWFPDFTRVSHVRRRNEWHWVEPSPGRPRHPRRLQRHSRRRLRVRPRGRSPRRPGQSRARHLGFAPQRRRRQPHLPAVAEVDGTTRRHHAPSGADVTHDVLSGDAARRRARAGRPRPPSSASRRVAVRTSTATPSWWSCRTPA